MAGAAFDAVVKTVPKLDKSAPLSVIVFGATGDLAKKKLFPALYQLMLLDHFPPHVNIVAYGRKEVVMTDFLEKQCSQVKYKEGVPKATFYSRISFHAGGYDAPEAFERLDTKLKQYEEGKAGNRLYFLSIPPTIFGEVCKCIAQKSRAAAGGFTHLIIEKPFGRDSATFDTLNSTTSSLFKETELYRIDHYLGKEVVLNLTTLRWANQIFESTWNNKFIQSVEITFKEDLGTGGRGGYFDGFGIMRDIMQNHLLQVFMLMAMEPPAGMTTQGIINAKVELLKAVQTLDLSNGVFLGQFTANSWTDAKGKTHEEPGYQDDSTVPKGSKCPTFAAVVLRINNPRWQGVPFLMKAGKGLDERLAEVRVRFKPQPYNSLMNGDAESANELVMRIQPDEALFLKTVTKKPGLEQINRPTIMEMQYKEEFAGAYVGDAYERMFLNAAKGDGSLFVSAAELVEAWRIFTPVLHQIEAQKPDVVLYPFNSQHPPGFAEWSKRNAQIEQGANWSDFVAMHTKEADDLTKSFSAAAGATAVGAKQKIPVSQMDPLIAAAAKSHGGNLDDKKVAQIAANMKQNADKDGMISLEEYLKTAAALKKAASTVQDKHDHSDWAPQASYDGHAGGASLH
jgi:glucose-6-phosphate 1-dehydrogenase